MPTLSTPSTSSTLPRNGQPPLSLEQWRRLKGETLTNARRRLDFQWAWVYGQGALGFILLMGGVSLVDPLVSLVCGVAHRVLGLAPNPTTLAPFFGPTLFSLSMLLLFSAIGQGRGLREWAFVERRLYVQDMQPDAWARVEREIIQKSLLDSNPQRKLSEGRPSSHHVLAPRPPGRLLTITPTHPPLPQRASAFRMSEPGSEGSAAQPTRPSPLTRTRRL